MVAQGELWLLEAPNDKSRPVLVVSRNEVIPVVNNVVVAPVTSTLRPIPTCVPVGRDEGLDHESVANFDNMAAVPKRLLTRRLGRLGLTAADDICTALSALADCQRAGLHRSSTS